MAVWVDKVYEEEEGHSSEVCREKSVHFMVDVEILHG